jgi:CRP/FNR family transcriptional regulator, cyclic AMP receptor protein
LKTDRTVEMLRVIPSLESRSDRELKKLAPLVDVVDIKSGRALTEQGRYDKQAFVIADGRADVTIEGEVVASLGPGDFVGEVSMLIGGPRTATVQAATPMTVLVMGQATFSSFISNEAISPVLSKQLARRLRTADGGFHETAGTVPS